MKKTPELKRFKISDVDREKLRRTNDNRPSNNKYTFITKWMGDKTNTQAWYLIEMNIW